MGLTIKLGHRTELIKFKYSFIDKLPLRRPVHVNNHQLHRFVTSVAPKGQDLALQHTSPLSPS